MNTFGQDSLPLDNDVGFNRSIDISSCRLDEQHIQIRGQLTDTHPHYEQAHAGETVVVHCIVVRLVVNASNGKVTDADFALPKMAFSGRCEHIPYGPELLVGLSTRTGFAEEIRKLYGESRSCFHIASLLQAMIPALPQCQTWNTTFKDLDQSLPAQMVPRALTRFQRSVKNSCHAWDEKDGFIVQDLKEGHYEEVLECLTPNLLARWKLYEAENKK